MKVVPREQAKEKVDKLKSITNEWENKNNEQYLKAQKESTRIAKQEGWDAISIDKDAGSFNRMTDNTIVLNPEAAKTERQLNKIWEDSNKREPISEGQLSEAKTNVNKFFTEPEASKRASDLLDRHSKSIIDDKGNFKTPFSKQDLEDLGYIGGFYVEKGIRNFADWSKEMVKDLGQGIKDHLQDIYDRLKTDKPELFREENLPEPKKIIDASGLTTLNMGFDPGIDKFYNQDLKPLAEKIANTTKAVVSTIAKIPHALGQVFQPAFSVEKKFGLQTSAEVIKGIHESDLMNIKFENARTRTYDANFKQVENLFAKYPKEVLDILNNARGDATSEAGKKLQAGINKKLPEELRDPKIMQSLKEVSDWIYKYGKEHGVDLDYFEDYFYGSYKDAKKVKNFIEYWRSTDKYTKEKTIPTIADAHAYGLELKEDNPIINLRKEAESMAHRVGLMDIKNYNDKTKAVYQTDIPNATIDQLDKWRPINDPVFRGQLFDPAYAKYVNSLIEANRLSQNGFLKLLRQSSQTLQQIKFVGSVFHLANMVKHSIASNTGGILNPKGFKDFVQGFKKYDEMSPEYQEYVKLGGSHKYSLEAQAETQMSKMLDNFKSGNRIGGLARIPATILSSKWIPASPGQVKWMFEDYIPTLKFERFKDNVAIKEKNLGRPLTDGEKIKSDQTGTTVLRRNERKIIRKIRNRNQRIKVVFYGTRVWRGKL